MDAARERAAELAAQMAGVLYALRVDPDPGFEYVSPSVEQLLGYTPEQLLARGAEGLVQTLHPEDRHVLDDVIRAPFDVILELAFRWIAADGSVVWSRHRARKERRPDGSAVLFGAAQDATAEAETRNALVESEHLYRLLAENSLDVVYRADLTHCIGWISPSITEVLGWEPHELVGQHVSIIANPDDVAKARRMARDLVESGGSAAQVEMRFRTKDGRWRWMRVTGRVLRDPDGQPLGGIDVLRDIQTEVEARQRLQHEVDHDPLTGLANRGRALGHLRDALEGDGAATVLVVGLDDLKAVNEALTFTAGDQVLRSVAERLTSEVGSHELVARVAGNEFAVLRPGSADADAAAALASRLLDAVQSSVRIGVHDLETSVTIGIAMATSGSAEDLLTDASTALHQAKSSGRGRWEFLDPTVSDGARTSIVVQSRLRDALVTGQIHAWFQPIVALADDEVRGYEALVRWEHDDGTIGAPDTFIPTAERTNLIVDLDRVVLRDSLDLLRRLPVAQHVSVNVSAASLSAPELVAVVEAGLQQSGVDPHRLHLEITETSLVHVTDKVRAAMRALSALGVRWYVDDFGTGFSSITHLRDLPVAGLKLDRSFTNGIGSGDIVSERLADGLAGLADGLELDTVAEGVETRTQAEALRQQGWLHGQGWLFGRPVQAVSIR